MDTNKILELFKSGTLENTSLAVCMLQHLDDEETRNVFIKIYRLIEDKEWMYKLLYGNEDDVRRIRIDLQVLPMINRNSVQVNIYCREYEPSGRFSDRCIVVIDSKIYVDTIEYVSNMKHKLLKAYGYE